MNSLTDEITGVDVVTFPFASERYFVFGERTGRVVRGQGYEVDTVVGDGAYQNTAQPSLFHEQKVVLDCDGEKISTLSEFAGGIVMSMDSSYFPVMASEKRRFDLISSFIRGLQSGLEGDNAEARMIAQQTEIYEQVSQRMTGKQE